MNKRIIIATSVVLLLLAGCGQPAPDLGNQNNPNYQNSPNNPNYTNNQGNPDNITPDDSNIAADTVNIDEKDYGNNGSNNNVNGTSNDKYTGNNTSKNNFRSLYFDFDRYNISSNMESNMNHNGRVANSKSSSIKIEGNCDEFGTDEYNYALGLKRAKTVKDRLSSQGVDSRRMVMVSFGESNPVCSEVTDSCYDKNRRVDILLAR
ncbi:MAG: OmpA family protein [Sulfurovum sp.]